MSAGIVALVAIATGIATAGLIVLLRPLLLRYAMARPNARSSHREPTPQGGGAAIMIALIAVLAVTTLAGHGVGARPGELATVLAAAAFIAVVGALDDLYAMPVLPRLGLQAVAVIAILAALPNELRVVPFVPWWAERTLLLIACLWLVNLTNFMDGIDWMTVAEVMPIAVALTILGAIGALPAHGMLVAAALGGALLGFAPFNQPVAKLFLGDVGSLPIGLLLAWLLLLLAGQGHLAAALLLPLYYLADSTVTLLRRMANGEPFWQAHRTHFYQRATDRGFSVMDVVARVFLVNLGLAGLALATVVVDKRPFTLIACLGGVALVAWLMMMLARGRT